MAAHQEDAAASVGGCVVGDLRSSQGESARALLRKHGPPAHAVVAAEAAVHDGGAGAILPADGPSLQPSWLSAWLYLHTAEWGFRLWGSAG